jgi:hypothetical protein
MRISFIHKRGRLPIVDNDGLHPHTELAKTYHYLLDKAPKVSPKAFLKQNQEKQAFKISLPLLSKGALKLSAL